jgi:hypothetical protein
MAFFCIETGCAAMLEVQKCPTGFSKREGIYGWV